MQIQPRVYQDEADLAAMRAILVAGRQAGLPAHYVHIGDLHWWLFFLNQEDSLPQTVYLWEDAAGTARPVGWTLFSPGFTAFDLFVDPTLYASPAATQMWIWSEEEFTSGMLAQGEQQICTCWVAEHDAWLNAHLRGRGFGRSDFTLVQRECPLVDDLASPTLPTGYRVRAVAGEEEAEQRAVPAHIAFADQRPFARYRSQYRAFMRSPVYTPALDLVVEAPDGQLVAFCLCWLDAVNRVGHVEPMGVHPAFQRRGLGRALMQAALRLMQARGMTRATLVTSLDNPAANRLYESVGFRQVYQIYTYKKALE